jgi:hypothetical protein
MEEQIHSLEADSRTARQKTPRLFMEPKDSIPCLSYPELNLMRVLRLSQR